MFSVRASPFNGKLRSTYGGAIYQGLRRGGRGVRSAIRGGWASHVAPDATLDDVDWGDDAISFYKDTKWASMAAKYAMDPVERARAKHIQALAKNFLKNTREDARAGDDGAIDWLERYKVALRATRSPYRFASLSPAQKQGIFRDFLRIPFNERGLTRSQRLFLQMGNRAPFAALPGIPADAAGDATDVASRGNMIVAQPRYYELTDAMRQSAARQRYGLNAADFTYGNAYNPADIPVPDDDAMA